MNGFTWTSDTLDRRVIKEQPSTEEKGNDRVSSSRLGYPYAWNSPVRERDQEADISAKTPRRPGKLNGCALPYGEERYLCRCEEGLYLVAGVIALANVDIMDTRCRYESVVGQVLSVHKALNLSSSSL